MEFKDLGTMTAFRRKGDPEKATLTKINNNEFRNTVTEDGSTTSTFLWTKIEKA